MLKLNTMSQLYVAIALVVLAIVAVLVVRANKSRKQRLSKIAALAFFLIIAGIVFGENHLIGYSLIGSGVVLALVDIKRGLKA